MIVKMNTRHLETIEDMVDRMELEGFDVLIADNGEILVMACGNPGYSHKLEVEALPEVSEVDMSNQAFRRDPGKFEEAWMWFKNAGIQRRRRRKGA